MGDTACYVKDTDGCPQWHRNVTKNMCVLLWGGLEWALELLACAQLGDRNSKFPGSCGFGRSIDLGGQRSSSLVLVPVYIVLRNARCNSLWFFAAVNVPSKTEAGASKEDGHLENHLATPHQQFPAVKGMSSIL